MTKITRTYKLTKKVRTRLLNHGIPLECGYQRCREKELRVGQTIVAVGYSHKTKHYHKKCRAVMYVA